MKPFNSRILVEEIKKDQKIESLWMPEETKDRNKLSKFLHVKILDIAPNIEEQFGYLKGKEAIIETGFFEEVNVNGKMFKFSPMNYIVAILDDSDTKKV